MSFVYNCIQTRLRGQYNGKLPISLVYMSKPLITVITAVCLIQCRKSVGHSCLTHVVIDVLVGWKEPPAHFDKHLTSDQQITFDKSFQVSPHFTYFSNTLMRQLHNFFLNNWIKWLSYPSSLKIRKVYTSIGSLKFLFLFSCTTFSQKYIVSFMSFFNIIRISSF